MFALPLSNFPSPGDDMLQFRQSTHNSKSIHQNLTAQIPYIIFTSVVQTRLSMGNSSTNVNGRLDAYPRFRPPPRESHANAEKAEHSWCEKVKGCSENGYDEDQSQGVFADVHGC